MSTVAQRVAEGFRQIDEIYDESIAKSTTLDLSELEAAKLDAKLLFMDSFTTTIYYPEHYQ